MGVEDTGNECHVKRWWVDYSNAERSRNEVKLTFCTYAKLYLLFGKIQVWEW